MLYSFAAAPYHISQIQACLADNKNDEATKLILELKKSLDEQTVHNLILFNIQQTCQILGCCRQSLYGLIKRKKIKASRGLKGKYKISLAEINRFILEN